MTIARSRTAVLLAAAALSTGLGAGLPATGAAARPVPAAARPAAAVSPNPSSRYNVLTGVSADSAGDAWAVGSYLSDATGIRDTLILHWNGTAWTLR